MVGIIGAGTWENNNNLLLFKLVDLVNQFAILPLYGSFNCNSRFDT
jgi:hypothetical protein